MKSIPDPDYDSYTVSLDELKQKTFKTKVKQVCRIPYKNFAVSRSECNIIIAQNLLKAKDIIKSADLVNSPDTIKILETQLSLLEKTLIFYCIHIMQAFTFIAGRRYVPDPHPNAFKA